MKYWSNVEEKSKKLGKISKNQDLDFETFFFLRLFFSSRSPFPTEFSGSESCKTGKKNLRPYIIITIYFFDTPLCVGNIIMIVVHCGCLFGLLQPPEWVARVSIPKKTKRGSSKLFRTSKNFHNHWKFAELQTIAYQQQIPSYKSNPEMLVTLAAYLICYNLLSK